MDNTLRKHLDDLVKEGKIEHQEDGYSITRGWKEGQPKAFILLELSMPKKKGTSPQKELVKEIEESFRRVEHPGLHLISADITMGSEFSLIIQVYSDNLHPIGRFVKDYLLTHEMVRRTRTIMVWPTEPGEPASSG